MHKKSSPMELGERRSNGLYEQKYILKSIEVIQYKLKRDY